MASRRGTVFLLFAQIIFTWSLLLSSVLLASSYKSIRNRHAWREPFLVSNEGRIIRQQIPFLPRGGGSEEASGTTGTNEADDTIDNIEDSEEDESMWIGNENPQEENESESLDTTQDSEEDKDEWNEPVTSRQQHEVEADSWFEENQEQQDRANEERDGLEDINNDMVLEREEGESDDVSEENYLDLSDEVTDDTIEEEAHRMEEVGVFASESIQEEIIVTADFSETENTRTVMDVDPSQDDEGSSPSEMYPEEPDARLDELSMDDTKVDDGAVFGSGRVEEVEGEGMEIAMTQHSTDDDSTAFVDRMELADAEDEGETTAGGYGDSFAVEEERLQNDIPENSPDDNSASTTQESHDETTTSDPSSMVLGNAMDDSIRQVLRKELHYPRYEVNRMKPEIAVVVAEKRLQRPAEGIPWNWYAQGYSPDRFERVKKTASTAVMVGLSTFVLVQNRRNIFGFLLPRWLMNKKEKNPQEATTISDTDMTRLYSSGDVARTK